MASRSRSSIRRSKNRIELNSGRYELELAGEKPGLKLSTERFTIKRGDVIVATVRHESTASATKPNAAPELMRGPEPEQVGEIACFESPHDFTHFVGMSPDSRRVVYTTAGEAKDGQWLPGTDPAIWIGDLDNPSHPRKIGLPSPSSVALSKDGRLVLTAGNDKMLRLWDIETGKSRLIRSEEGGIGQVAFAPDQLHAAYLMEGAIRLCDLKTGEVVMTLRGHPKIRCMFQFCDDGNRLVSAGIEDHTIRVWDLKTGDEVRPMQHGDGVISIAVFADSRRVLSASSDATIRVWDIETGRELRRIMGIANGNGWGGRVAVSPDGRRALFVADAGDQQPVWLWDLETGQAIHRFRRAQDLSGHSRFRPMVASRSRPAWTRPSAFGHCPRVARPVSCRPWSRRLISSVTPGPSMGSPSLRMDVASCPVPVMVR